MVPFGLLSPIKRDKHVDIMYVRSDLASRAGSWFLVGNIGATWHQLSEQIEARTC